MYNGKQVSICIPTVNNYVGLREELESIEAGSIKPDKYYIINNGGNFSIDIPGRMYIHNTPRISLAACWNWFIDNVPEYRIIINDDIVFYNDTLEVFLKAIKDDAIYFPYGIDRINSFSFFSMPDSIVQRVGRFDEEFYPAYFEDNSYDYRLGLAGTHVMGVYDCNLIHRGSQTIQNYTSAQINQHHKDFEKSRQLYIKMWGGMPKQEKYVTKYNG